MEILPFSRRLVCYVLVLALHMIASRVQGSRLGRGEPDGLADYADPFLKLEVRMPGVRPKMNDDYICHAHKINSSQELYIRQFNVNADAQRAHHMLLYGCPSVDFDLAAKGAWDCGHHGVCPGSQILFAWAKNAPATTLPPNVAFRVGGSTQIQYIVMQVHYAHPLSPDDEDDRSGVDLSYSYTPEKYIAGIFLLMTSRTVIPPHTPKTYGEANCLSNQPASIHPFAFRVHAHKLGVVITGYKYDQKTDNMEEIARGNPQWPQAFYPMKKVFSVDSGDILVARCTFNSTSMNYTTQIGSTAGDEMCNLYIMYYTDARNGSSFAQCVDEQIPGFHARLPADSDQPLPPNPLLEEHALHGKHSQVNHGTERQMITQNPINMEHLDYNGLFASSKQGTSSKKADPTFHSKKKPIPFHVETYDTYNNQDESFNYPEGPVSSAELDLTKTADYTLPKDIAEAGFQDVAGWLKPETLKLVGQPSAVALDSANNIVIFHRSSRAWTSSTFNNNNALSSDEGPIPEPTLITVSSSGALIRKSGQNFFYMPHGLTIDHEDNLWVTDVGLHQVFKIKPLSDKPMEIELSLGTKLKPGKGDNLFCKPTSVAVLKSGEFYVADGYCNSRVIKYTTQGTKLMEWGEHPTYAFGFKVAPPNSAFDIPHSLALAEEKDTLCVADRENKRIQCYAVSTGKYKYQINSHVVSGIPYVYGLAYSSANGGELLAVTWTGNDQPSPGLIFDISNGQPRGFFKPSPNEFSRPHEMAVSRDGNHIFVADIEKNHVWYLKKGNLTLKSVSPAIVKASVVPSINQTAILPFEGKGSAGKPVTPSWSMYVFLMSLIAVPMLFVVLITAVVKLRKRGGLRCCRKVSSINSLLGTRKSHNGFEKLAMEDSESGSCSDQDESETDVVEYKASGLKA